MAGTDFRKALIVGAGAGLSAALARAFAQEGIAVALAARSTDDLRALAAETGAQVHACDASRRADVERLFAELDAQGAQGVQGAPDVVAYNASYRTRGPFIELDADEVEKSLRVSALAGFFVAQAAARRMLKAGHGAIFFTGASASRKGYAQSAPFAMGKFALRGLAQSMARELSPQGIHVAHVVVDGGIRSARRPDAADRPDATLDPDAIAASYLHLLQQQRSAWTWEIEVRPWVEKF
jgi:NAD(P)-dependent dehydrogenase (short-subunit alcohol dehydrogenase family)